MYLIRAKTAIFLFRLFCVSARRCWRRGPGLRQALRQSTSMCLCRRRWRLWRILPASRGRCRGRDCLWACLYLALGLGFLCQCCHYLFSSRGQRVVVFCKDMKTPLSCRQASDDFYKIVTSGVCARHGSVD